MVVILSRMNPRDHFRFYYLKPAKVDFSRNYYATKMKLKRAKWR